MLTTDTKRHIDAARQVLVGKVPNPIQQVQEITNALIYKFMDDMDELAASVGGKRRYFTGEFDQYSWRKLMDPKVGSHERMDLYDEALNRLGTSKNLPELFRSIFRNARLPFRDGRTLTLFLQEINYFDYKHSEELGNAYEYLLSIMGSQGDAGQFRTPRHIIDFIVEAVNPGKNDSVLDPACGTAGFLISAYKHVVAKHDGKDDDTGEYTAKEQLLTADEKQKLHRNYIGFDIDDNMVKMSQVNMFLHGFTSPNIIVHDSLSSEDYWQERYDVILANPPFMSPRGGIQPHNKFSVQSTRSEVLFVDFIMSHLKPSGRAGVIVPEGIIFQSGSAHKQLRKKLVEDGLYAVVSLPSGVFQPYAGVKTSILLFDNELAKQKSELLFLKIEKDGYQLNAQRTKSCNDYGDEPQKCPVHSDLPEALEILKHWRLDEKVDSNLAAFVEKTKVAADGDYNLSSERYRVAIDYSNAKWPMVKLGEIAEILKGSAITKKDTKAGKIPVVAGGQEPAYFHDSSNRTGDIITVSASGAYAGFVNFFDSPIFASDCSTIQSKDSSRVHTKYIYRILKGMQDDIYALQQGGGQPHVYPRDLIQLLIPLPPLEIQEKIVAELDGYEGIIAGAKQIAQNWKPKIDIDLEWPMVKLGDVCDVYQSKTITSNEIKKIGKYKVYGANGVIGYYDEYNHEDVEVAVTCRGATCGTVNITESKSWITGNAMVVKPKENNINKKYLFHLLRGTDLSSVISGSAQPQITGASLKPFEIPLPPLEIQKKIVEKIEAERTLVESTKKLIEIYEQKTKDTITKLWEVK